MNPPFKIDRRIILFALFAVIAVSFSIYRAVGAFSSDTNRPQSNPPPAFVTPVQPEITKVATAGKVRLPTDLEVKLLKNTAILAAIEADSGLSYAKVKKIGSYPQLAKDISGFKNKEVRRFGLKGQTNGAELNSLTNGEVQTSANIIFTDTKGDAAPLSATIQVLWKLTSSAKTTGAQLIGITLAFG